MAPAIPDRWLKYKPIGKRVDGTRFIAFKVPLREHVLKSVDKELRLDSKQLLATIPNLGMVIDLTNTSRYYDPSFFQENGLKYMKLMIPGHQTPAPHLVKKFKWHVINFLNDNRGNDKLIGVHCTHGVNRTGYFICNYMISEMGVRPDDAIRKFASARGHYIERENYLDDLNKLTVRSRDSRWNSKNSGNTSNSNLSYRRPSTISSGFFVSQAQSTTGSQMWRDHAPPPAPLPTPITVTDLLQRRNNLKERKTPKHRNTAYCRPSQQSVLSFASCSPRSVRSTTSESQYSVLSGVSDISWDCRSNWTAPTYPQRGLYFANPYETLQKTDKPVKRTVKRRLHSREAPRACSRPYNT